jgi:hypothetical protein
MHFLDRRAAVSVITTRPEVFADLDVTTKPWTDELRQSTMLRRVSFSLRRRAENGVSQFDLCCRNAGIVEPVKLDMRWRPENRALCSRVRRAAGGRKILVYQPLKVANRTMLSPRDDYFARWIAARSDCYRVKIGHPLFTAEHEPLPCELDLVGKTSVHDVFDLGTAGDLFFGELSYLPIMAQAMGKQFVCMFSRAAAEDEAWRHLTPERMFKKPHFGCAVYDENVCDALA